ncbi:MAG: hypothetical protein V3S51_07140 [Dehalococcoidia bacterium]
MRKGDPGKTAIALPIAFEAEDWPDRGIRLSCIDSMCAVMAIEGRKFNEGCNAAFRAIRKIPYPLYPVISRARVAVSQQ